MGKYAGLVFLLLIAAGCGHKPADELSKLSDEFVYTALANSPSTATNVGLHTYQNQKLDDLLDDFSPAALERQKRFYAEFEAKLNRIAEKDLDAQGRADLAILRDQTALVRMDFQYMQTALHNPTMYVENLGNALFGLYVLESSPKPDRFRSIIARLRGTPVFLNNASINLISSPKIWTDVAVQENQGNIDLVDKVLREQCPAELKDEYAKAATPAIDAMQKFGKYLTDNLSQRTSDWRLGKTLYVRKFRYVLQSGMEADAALATAERELRRVRERMLSLSEPLHRQWFPGHKDHQELGKDAQQNMVIGEVLGRIAERHSTRDSYMDDARKDLDEARAFVTQKHLLTLPARANLQVIPTPEFMRGIYAVGGFVPAPALEPNLGAFYWVTPIPTDWLSDRANSKLREYNFYKLKLLTIHEAIPGHYVQAEYANDVQPAGRRILRSIYGNGPYIEGWAEYITQVMLEEGFLDNSPEMALTFAKEELRVLANAVLDVRLQMLNMTDEEAMDLMQQLTFQEKEEAEAKLQRAKLSSAQLPTYFVGWQAWRKLRADYQKSKGANFSLSQFHDQALKQGAIPLPMLGQLLQ